MQRYLLKDSDSKSILREWLGSSMTRYAGASGRKWNDEDSLCEAFLAAISGTVRTPSGEINIQSYKVRGHGPGTEERKLGADGLGIVGIETVTTHLAGYFLFQAKKAPKLTSTLTGSRAQCRTMLSHSAASYLLALLPSEVKMVGAHAVSAHQSRDPSLAEVPFVGFPWFVVQHLLLGLMLEPFEKACDTLTPDLAREIRHVLTIYGEAPGRVERARFSVDQELKELKLI